MAETVKTPLVIWLTAGVTVCISVALLLLNDGNFLVAMAPPLVVVVFVGIIKAPFRIAVAGFVFFAMLVEDVRAAPFMGRWRSPLHGIGRIFYDGLDKTLGLPGLKIYGVEFLYLFLLFILGLSWFWHKKRIKMPAAPLVAAAAIAVATVIGLEFWGIARGGVVRFSVLQMRPLLFTGMAVLLFSFAFCTRRDTQLVLGIILAVGVIRAMVGFYYWRFVLVREEGSYFALGGGSYITTHADTVLWVTGLIICLITLLIKPSRRAIWLNVTVSPILVMAIIVNNRRLAIISLVMGLGIFYLLTSPVVRRRLNRILAFTFPAILLYIAVAWNSGGAWAKPVRSIKSVIFAEDSSVDMRTIENYNLYVTTRHHPIMGQGFGHEYEEVSVAISITDALEAYLYLPHNSLMWLMGAGGLVGFTLYWMIFVVGAFLAVRVSRTSDHLIDQVGSLTAIITVNTFMIQAMGDSGIYSWLSIMVLTPLLGLMGGRAAELNAWPMSRKLNDAHD